jgi:hypothetical protein
MTKNIQHLAVALGGSLSSNMTAVARAVIFRTIWDTPALPSKHLALLLKHMSGVDYDPLIDPKGTLAAAVRYGTANHLVAVNQIDLAEFPGEENLAALKRHRAFAETEAEAGTQLVRCLLALTVQEAMGLLATVTVWMDWSRTTTQDVDFGNLASLRLAEFFPVAD